MPNVSVTPRLPSRCPVCKGAVIQRMGRAHGSIWFHCLFCKHNWRFRLEDARAVPDGELTGDVCVMTRRTGRHALARVAVNVIPEHLLKQHLENKRAQWERETKRLQREIDTVASWLDKVRGEEERLWKIQDRDKDDMRKASAWNSAYNKMKTIIEQRDELLVRQRRLISGEPFFQDLPSPISSTKTDADGRFTVAIPREGRYGIVARAARDLDHETRIYTWFVWVSLDGASATRLVLNDDNVVGAGSPHSALQ